MRYEGTVIRPPSEAQSYILQCTIGCSHNRCTFCGAFKDKKFRIRDMQDILTDIKLAKDYYGDVAKVFLADGDALAMETEDLLEVISALSVSFPSLTQVATYTSPVSILEKSMDDLVLLREAGIAISYMGVETGDRALLEEIRKGVTYEEMVEAGLKIKRAGMVLSVTVILGLAGRNPRAVDHARNTAKILNEINPDYISALTLMLRPGTEIRRRQQRGEFELPGPFEILNELRLIIQELEVQGTELRSNHASNYLPIRGSLPKDKQQLVDLIDAIITSGDQRYLRPDYLREQ